MRVRAKLPSSAMTWPLLSRGRDVLSGAGLVHEAETVSTSMDQAPPKPRRSTRSQVQVFRNWCKGCGICIAFCPRQVFVEGEENRPIVAHEEQCSGCQWCAMHCPDFAIEVTSVSESGQGAGHRADAQGTDAQGSAG